jgi:hypothetical protein
VEVVVQYLEWKDMIPLSDYQNFEEKQQKTLRSICSFVQRSGRQNMITDEDTKLAQLVIMLRDRTLDWYMSLDMNNALG